MGAPEPETVILWGVTLPYMSLRGIPGLAFHTVFMGPHMRVEQRPEGSERGLAFL